MKFSFTKLGFTYFSSVGGARTMMDMLALGLLKLNSNIVAFDWNVAIGAFTEAAFTGYVPIDLSVAGNLAGPYFDLPKQEVYGKTPMRGFGLCTALPETEQGFFLVDKATGLIVWGMATFDAPQFVAIGDVLRVNVLYPIGQGTELSGIELDAT